jgi:hypothetical protein
MADTTYDRIKLATIQARMFGLKVITLAAGEAIVLDVRGMGTLTMIAGAGATITWSRVDTSDAGAHVGAGTTIAATEVSAISVDWPFVRISVAGGSARVAAV